MTNDDRFKEAIEELVNSVQVLAGLSIHLRRDLGASAEQAVVLEAAVDRAVRALRRLQPPSQEVNS